MPLANDLTFRSESRFVRLLGHDLEFATLCFGRPGYSLSTFAAALVALGRAAGMVPAETLLPSAGHLPDRRRSRFSVNRVRACSPRARAGGPGRKRGLFQCLRATGARRSARVQLRTIC